MTSDLRSCHGLCKPCLSLIAQAVSFYSADTHTDTDTQFDTNRQTPLPPLHPSATATEDDQLTVRSAAGEIVLSDETESTALSAVTQHVVTCQTTQLVAGNTLTLGQAVRVTAVCHAHTHTHTHTHTHKHAV